MPSAKSFGTFVRFDGPGRPQTAVRARLPALRDGELLVRNDYATLCRSDVTTWLGQRTEATPTILGHEVVGHIAACGPSAPRTDLAGRELAVGHRITWAIYASDPTTELARLGMPQKAPGRCKYGHEPLRDDHGFHGGLAEYTVLRRHTPIVRLDAAIPAEVAAMTNCAVATVAGALRLAGDVTGRTVLVSGVGALGVFACAMAAQRGARVFAIDVDPVRAERARSFGALDCFAAGDPRQLPRGDVVLECSGAPAAIERTMEQLELGGTAIWVGAVMPQRPVQIDAERVVRQLLTVRGLHNYIAADLATAAEFVTQQHTRYPFAQMVQGGFDLSSVDAAFHCAAEQRPLRVGVRTTAPATAARR